MLDAPHRAQAVSASRVQLSTLKDCSLAVSRRDLMLAHAVCLALKLNT